MKYYKYPRSKRPPLQGNQYLDIDGNVLTVSTDFLKNKSYYNSKGQRHRLDGPAIEFKDGSYAWYKNGKLHRRGGPAYFDGIEYEWWYNGKKAYFYYIYG